MNRHSERQPRTAWAENFLQDTGSSMNDHLTPTVHAEIFKFSDSEIENNERISLH
jgi:hypothetical protein